MVKVRKVEVPDAYEEKQTGVSPESGTECCVTLEEEETVWPSGWEGFKCGLLLEGLGGQHPSR